jgi:hypothetical protein
MSTDTLLGQYTHNLDSRKSRWPDQASEAACALLVDSGQLSVSRHPARRTHDTSQRQILQPFRFCSSAWIARGPCCNETLIARCKQVLEVSQLALCLYVYHGFMSLLSERIITICWRMAQCHAFAAQNSVAYHRGLQYWLFLTSVRCDIFPRRHSCPPA